MKKGRVGAIFDEKYIKENRTFPKGKSIWLGVILIIQIITLVIAFSMEVKPKDIIRQYDVTVEPLSDGTLDIEYHFVWEALDTSEELTWIKIGMANMKFTVYPNSTSSTVRSYYKDSYDGEVFLRLDLNRAYKGGEVLEFSFKINQKNMLCKDDFGYFYEFVPGWFNEIPVENYNFRWMDNGEIRSLSGGKKEKDYYEWSGSLECGGYKLMSVLYGKDSFDGCSTAKYIPFDDEYAYNSLESDKNAGIGLSIVIVLILAAVQVWIVDSVVSYHRGRGFLSGHGFYVHTYGRSNPHYIKARDSYNALHGRGYGGGRSGGGCACACACACAGGGRAGCSEKDTYDNTRAATK